MVKKKKKKEKGKYEWGKEKTLELTKKILKEKENDNEKIDRKKLTYLLKSKGVPKSSVSTYVRDYPNIKEKNETLIWKENFLIEDSDVLVQLEFIDVKDHGISLRAAKNLLRLSREGNIIKSKEAILDALMKKSQEIPFNDVKVLFFKIISSILSKAKNKEKENFNEKYNETIKKMLKRFIDMGTSKDKIEIKRKILETVRETEPMIYLKELENIIIKEREKSFEELKRLVANIFAIICLESKEKRLEIQKSLNSLYKEKKDKKIRERLDFISELVPI